MTDSTDLALSALQFNPVGQIENWCISRCRDLFEGLPALVGRPDAGSPDMDAFDRAYANHERRMGDEPSYAAFAEAAYQRFVAMCESRTDRDIVDDRAIDAVSSVSAHKSEDSAKVHLSLFREAARNLAKLIPYNCESPWEAVVCTRPEAVLAS